MILVTGGAGFIGSNLVRSLNKRGIKDIWIVDNLENGDKHKNLNRLEFSEIFDKREFIKMLPGLPNKQFDIIFHQGACSSTTEYNGRYLLENNYEYSRSLLNYALVGQTPFIYASSASVYGDGNDGFKEELTCEYPLNAYAYSKFLFDQYVRKIIGSAKSQIIGLRYFNVYGPQENHKGSMASVIFHFHNQIQAEGKMKLFEGSAKFIRDFIYVQDVADVNLFFMDHPEKSGIVNCGTGKAESFLKIAEIMQPLYGGAEIVYIPFPDKLKGKYQTFTQADPSNLRSAGYQKEFSSLEKGVTDYVSILKKSQGFYR